MTFYRQDEEGDPILTISMEDFSKAFNGKEAHGVHPRVVALDQVGDVSVSTVFLGIDHSLGVGKPVLWETKVCGGVMDEFQQRYTSVLEAMEGHGDVLRQVLKVEEYVK